MPNRNDPPGGTPSGISSTDSSITKPPQFPRAAGATLGAILEPSIGG
jgi:hypothetical protein